MAKIKRALVIGLDGMDPKYVARFSEEGLLPNMTRLIRRGAFGRLVSVPPAQTPANWTSIATRAWPGTHNIVMWGDHVPGEFPANVHRAEAMSSNLCGAEYLWEAAAGASAEGGRPCASPSPPADPPLPPNPSSRGTSRTRRSWRHGLGAGSAAGPPSLYSRAGMRLSTREWSSASVT
jgi:predicted AlkP superfamily phosphohydrolase/phosphomutase